MKILMVTPYPPSRNGIAAYSEQLAKHLRAGGDRVAVVSPDASGAQYRANPHTIGGVLRIILLSRRHHRTLIQYTPDLFFGRHGKLGFLRDIAGLALVLLAGRRVEVYAHEADYGKARGRRRRMWSRVWRLADRVVTHTERERTDLIKAFSLDPQRVIVVHHGAAFVPRTSADRDAARRRLGVAPDQYVFLCIGFIQPHKGFDRAVRALARLDAGRKVRLDIVGSVRVRTDEFAAYLTMLRRMVEADPRANLHEGYVTDARFDTWIVAADAVVLPYREIWSSGVIERAALFNRPAIITEVGGLAHQARDNTVIVHNEVELAEAMARLAGVRLARPAEATQAVTCWEDAMEAVRRGGAALRRWHEAVEPQRRTAVATRRGLEEPLLLPQPNVGGWKRPVLKVVSRFTRWQLRPVIDYVNHLRGAVLYGEAPDEADDDRPFAGEGQRSAVDDPDGSAVELDQSYQAVSH